MRSTRSVPLPAAEEGTFRRIVRRNIGAIGGLALLAFCAAVATSLATWRADDPSLSHATDLIPRNFLGVPGALVSDLFMQFLGLASILALLVPVVWAWRLVFANPSRFTALRFLSWIGGTLAAAAGLAALPVTKGWALPTGLGGVSGDLLLGLFGSPGGFTGGVFCLVLAFLSTGLILHSGGFVLRPAPEEDEEPVRPIPGILRTSRAAPMRDEEDDDYDFDDEDDEPGRMALLLGAAGHIAYRFGGMMRRFVVRFGRQHAAPFARQALERAMRGQEERQPFGSDGRIEPMFGARGATEERWEEDEDEPDFEPEMDDEGEEEDLPPPPEKKRRVSEPHGKLKGARRTLSAPARRAVHFELPPVQLLTEPKATGKTSVSMAALEQNARLLEGVLDDFGVRGEIMNVRPGPVVTLYELEPAPGIKSARVIGLADDIARSMSAIAARVAVIPGKNAIGIELPNARRETVYLRELIAAEDFVDSKAKLALCLGKTIGGEPVIADLARMPHLLVAGTTGSGKSVSINTMILSLVYRHTPEQCRLIMIDPKMLELSIYDGIPHLLTPVVTDPKQAVVALKWTVREMEDRYRKMSKLGVRNIDGFNARVTQAKTKRETLTRTIQTGFDRETGQAIYEQEELPLEAMPYIVVIIDEMADLMMVAGKDIEGTVQRLAQMARAAGIHVIMATQRPSVDVITGTIKANFPTRISFQVTSKIDSRTILGEQGAEQLLGQGDMLYMAGGGRITRVHGPFVSDEEVEEVVAHLKDQGTPEYLEAITSEDDEDGDGGGYDAMAGGEGESNDLYDKAVAIVLRDKKASTSYIQRRLSIGYNRAASIIERMEKEGLVGPANHAGKREILVEDDEGESRFR